MGRKQSNTVILTRKKVKKVTFVLNECSMPTRTHVPD